MIIKIAVLGAPGVGKTFFINSHETGGFEFEYKKTEKESITIINFNTTKGQIEAHLYDKMEKPENADAYILMFNPKDVGTIYHLFKYNDIISGKPVIPCANKADLGDTGVNFHDIIKYLCHGECAQISVKNNYNIKNPILEIFRQKYGDLQFVETKYIFMKIPSELYNHIIKRISNNEKLLEEFKKSVW